MPDWLSHAVTFLTHRRQGVAGTEGGGDDVPPRLLAAISAAITAYLEAEAAERGGTAPGFAIRGVTGPWAARPGSTASFGWAQVGRMELMLERHQIATRRRTSQP